MVHDRSRDSNNYELEHVGTILAFAGIGCMVWLQSLAQQPVAARLPEFRQNYAIFIDVRSASEFAMGNAPGSINIPLPEIGSRLHELPKDKDIVLFCASGTRSGMAALLLRQKGFSKVHNAGTCTNVMNH